MASLYELLSLKIIVRKGRLAKHVWLRGNTKEKSSPGLDPDFTSRTHHKTHFKQKFSTPYHTNSSSNTNYLNINTIIQEYSNHKIKMHLSTSTVVVGLLGLAG